MNKKIILIILIIAIAIISVGFYYFTYIADHTYSDERMSITVPPGTTFNITAKDTGGDFSSITYNDSSKKNIVVKMMKVPESSFFGVSMKDYTIQLQENILTNKSYISVKVTDNYTIYYNNQTGRYNALIRNPGFNGYVGIGCNGNLDDIEQLAKSFKFKSYTTEGLTIEHVNTSNNETNTISNNTVNGTTTSSTSNTNSNKLYNSKQEAVDETGQGDISPEQEKKLEEWERNNRTG